MIHDARQQFVTVERGRQARDDVDQGTETAFALAGRFQHACPLDLIGHAIGQQLQQRQFFFVIDRCGRKVEHLHHADCPTGLNQRQAVGTL